MGGCPLPGLFCWGVAVWVAMDLLTMVANHSQQSHPGSMIPDYLGVLVTGLTKKYPKNNCYYNYNGMKMFKHLNHRSTFIQACHYQLCPTFIPGAGNDTATLVGIVQGYSYWSKSKTQDLGLSCWGDLLKVKCLPALVHHATQIFQRTKKKSTGSKVSFSPWTSGISAASFFSVSWLSEAPHADVTQLNGRHFGHYTARLDTFTVILEMCRCETLKKNVDTCWCKFPPKKSYTPFLGWFPWPRGSQPFIPPSIEIMSQGLGRQPWNPIDVAVQPNI